YSKARVLLLEKYETNAKLNSNSKNNGQTLHFGDIETTYTLEKAKRTKAASEMLLVYTSKLPTAQRNTILSKTPQMVLAVGSEEVEFLRKKYDPKYRALFPGMRMINKKEIGRLEPNLLKGRDRAEALIAAYSAAGYGIDFGRLSDSFVKKAQGAKVSFNDGVISVKQTTDGYSLKTTKSSYCARFVVFSAGAQSLKFAKQLGYGLSLSVIPILGSFYYSRAVVKSKIYTVQGGSIPFLGAHADPDINSKDRTRFGPTITPYPFLEKSKPLTIIDHLNAVGMDLDYMRSITNIMRNKDLSSAFLRNLGYRIPLLGKPSFVKDQVQKIVPSLRNEDVKYDISSGGIRPQIIDKSKRSINVGESTLSGESIIFNITPSPGASSCLRIALDNANEIARSLDIKLDSTRIQEDFKAAAHA
ncbi:MAG: malate:quinone oxidoreductase, partial [Candidatus Micrarchaeota archaeon]|nr:malate:quinone oxidoreductase [Candidatus Micrarchaeota archaeon]